MKDGKTPSNYYRLLQIALALAAVGVFISTFTMKFTTPTAPSWLGNLIDVDRLKTRATTIGAVSASVAAAAGVLKRYATHPNTWRQVQAILDRLQTDVFNKHPIPGNRITLFRCQTWLCLCGGWRPRWRWYWPWGKWNMPWAGWLQPFARSGMFRKKSRCVFLAPPNEPHHAEGVAGQAFQLFKSGTQLDPIEGLPDLTTDSTAEERAAYAKKGHVPIEWVDWMLKHGRQLPLSLTAVCVEVDGKLWGILVIDSRLPALPNKTQIERATTAAAELLSAALRR